MLASELKARFANFHCNGTLAVMKAYARHHLTPTKEMPTKSLAAVPKCQDGTAKLNLLLDICVADCWVFSSQLADCGHYCY
ncbi:hypothetical protein WAI453_011914 [Rhynchosporium graminicola]